MTLIMTVKYIRSLEIRVRNWLDLCARLWENCVGATRFVVADVNRYLTNAEACLAIAMDTREVAKVT